MKKQVLALLGLALFLAACGGSGSGGGSGGGGGGGNNTPTFTISLSSGQLDIPQGGSATVQLTITPQNNFTGQVSLSLVDQNGSAVSDITLNPPTVDVPSGSSQVNQDLNIGVNQNAQTGSRALNLKATSGNITKQTPLTITVQQGSGGGGGGSNPSSITLTVEDPEEKFIAAAYQVGTGSWQALSVSETTKTATIQMNNETKYGVAVRCASGVKVIQATSTELANPKIECSSLAPSTVSFRVDVTISDIQVESGDGVCVNDNLMWCSPVTQTGGGASATVNVSNAPAVSGGRDLLITLKKGSSSGLNWVKVAKVVRNVQVQDGDTIPVTLTDNDSTNPSDPLSVQPAPSGYTPSLPDGAAIVYLSANKTAVGIVNAALDKYRQVKDFGGDDLYIALIRANHPNAMLASLDFFSSGAPSLAFPTHWENESLTVTRHPHPRVSGLSREENDLKGYAISLSGIFNYNYTAFLSKGWLGNETSYTLPDLSDANLLGYTAPQYGDTVSISVTAAQNNKTVLTADPFSNLSIFKAGDYFKMAEAHTSFTVDESDSNPISFPQP